MEKLPCSSQDTCPLRDTQMGCFEDVHHLYFPRADYKKPIEREFRELKENKVIMCREWHNTDHAVFEAPAKPDLVVMKAAVALEKTKRLNGLA
jgi:hypothetical protein